MLAAINAVAAEFSNTPAAAPERVADVDRLSARRGVRRPRRGATAAGPRLAAVFYFGAAVTAVPDSGGVALRARIGSLAGAQAAGRRAGARSIARWRGWATRRSTRCRRFRPMRAGGRSRDIFAPGHRRGHRDRDAGVFLPHHDLLFHREVGAEDRRRSGLRAVVGRRRAGVDERGRRDRRRRASGC